MDAFTLTSSGLFRQSPGLQHPLLSEVVHAGVQHHPTLKVTNIHENTFFFLPQHHVWQNRTTRLISIFVLAVTSYFFSEM